MSEQKQILHIFVHLSTWLECSLACGLLPIRKTNKTFSWKETTFRFSKIPCTCMGMCKKTKKISTTLLENLDKTPSCLQSLAEFKFFSAPSSIRLRFRLPLLGERKSLSHSCLKLPVLRSTNLNFYKNKNFYLIICSFFHSSASRRAFTLVCEDFGRARKMMVING